MLWGSQIRSCFSSYSLVKDHRTGPEVGDVQAAMDGDLDPLLTPTRSPIIGTG